MDNKNCLMIKLPGTVTDTSIPKLNELRMKVLRDVTDGSSRILVNCVPNITDGRYPIVKYSGGFKNNSGASLGTSYKVTKTHIDPIFPSVELLIIEPKKNTYLIIENADRLSVLKSEKNGGGWANDTFLFDFDNATALPECMNFSLSTAKFTGDAGAYIAMMPNIRYFYLWNPTFSFDISYASESLRYLFLTTRNFLTGVSEKDNDSMANIDIKKLPSALIELVVSAPAAGSGVTGDIANLPASLSRFSVHSACNNTTGDLKNLPRSIKTFGATGDVLPEGKYTFTGTSFAGYTFTSFALAARLSTNQFDTLIIALAQASWSGTKTLTLYGQRSADSDEALTTLTNKGVTVTINAI